MSYLTRLNTLLTSTTSRYDSLRRNILSSSSEDDTSITDPQTSHVSRVLRAYYTEKALPHPPWLGPDPRERDPVKTQPQTRVRPKLGSLRSESVGGQVGGLGDIWGQADGRGRGEARPLPSQRVGSVQNVGVGRLGEGGGGGGGAAERLRARLNRGGSGRGVEGGEGRGGEGGGKGLGGWQGGQGGRY